MFEFAVSCRASRVFSHFGISADIFSFSSATFRPASRAAALEYTLSTPFSSHPRRTAGTRATHDTRITPDRRGHTRHTLTHTASARLNLQFLNSGTSHSHRTHGGHIHTDPARCTNKPRTYSTTSTGRYVVHRREGTALSTAAVPVKVNILQAAASRRSGLREAARLLGTAWRGTSTSPRQEMGNVETTKPMLG